MSLSTDSGGKKRVSSHRGTRIRLGPKLGNPDLGQQDQIREWLRETPRPWAIDLFSGAGGLSLGLAEAGFSVVAAADHDATALETHAYNIGGMTWCGDLGNPSEFISQLELWGINHVDLVAGGPPCQPFSRAGTPKIADLVKKGIRKPQDDRAKLWRSFLSVIDHLQADAVLVENVPDFARIQNGATLTALLSELEHRSYSTHFKLLDSWRHGVPQHRTRVFVVGLRTEGGFQWPETVGRKTTLRQAIGDLPEVEGGQREEELPYVNRPSTQFSRRMRRSVLGTDQGVIRDHITRYVREDDAEIFAGMQPGQTYRDVPPHLRRYRSDIFDDKYNRLKWDDLSRTITAHIAKDGYWYIHPSQDRTLSIREAARIQTFPDSFRFAGFPTSRYRQIGNAVPPILALSVGRVISEALQTRNIGEEAAVYVALPTNTIRDRLVRWYAKNGRPYVWREELDPWVTLLAEVCLHRTRADQVAGIFPSVRRLGATPHSLLKHGDELRALLSHLGLGWRTNLLFSLAEELTEEYEGVVPDSYDELIRLPGVGDYIASAVLCFAFGQPTTLIDTNTSRFVKRYSGDDNLPPWQQRLALHNMAKPGTADADWNYSLLDLGALVCKARQPECSACPVKVDCSTGKARLL